MNLSKSEKTIGFVLASLLFLITISSTFFFLVKLKVSFLDWIAFNACSPTSYLYLCCFLIFMVHKRLAFLLLITFLPIYYLGSLSMFVLPWNASYIVAHVGHIIMSLNLVWVLWIVLKYRDYKALALGLLVSVLLLAPYIAYVQIYNQRHAAEIARVLMQQ